MKRQGIFLLYDEQGCVDEYIVYMLQSMNRYFDKITVVCNGILSSEGRKKLESIDRIQVFVRENKGFDVWAYKEAMEHIGWEEIKDIDELIMFNYTLMGPVYEQDLDRMFKTMDAKNVDFWGLTLYHGVPFDPWGILPDHKLPDHLQSHFIAVRKHMLASVEFETYWKTRPMITCYEEAVAFHEAIFTQHFSNCGFKWKAYCNPEENVIANPYPLFMAPIQMVMDYHCPFFKRKLFFYPMKEKIVDSSSYISRVFYQFVKQETPYDETLILKNLIRTAPMQDIVDGLGLNVIPDSECERIAEKIAVVIDEDFYLQHQPDIDDLETHADLYYWGSKESFHQKKNWEKMHLLECTTGNFAEVYYAVGAFAKEYEYICFLVNEDRSYIAENLDNGHTGWIIENSILGKGVSLGNIVSCLNDNSGIGLVYSPNSSQSLYYSRQYKERELISCEIQQILENSDIYLNIAKVRGSIGQYTGCFWCRSQVLQNLTENVDVRKWLLAQTDPCFVFTSVLSLCAQSMGYYTARSYNKQLAGIQIDSNDVMNDEINAAVQNTSMSFPQMCKKLECLQNELTCIAAYDYGQGFASVYQKKAEISYSDNGNGEICIPVPRKVKNIKLIFNEDIYVIFDGLRCEIDGIDISGDFIYKDDRYSILHGKNSEICLTGTLDGAAAIKICFDEMSYGYLGHGMNSIINSIQYKENQLADMRLSLQDYQNDLINKKAVIALQERRLKEVREENKKLKEEQKQLYEINGYLTNERNALVEYRNAIENSKTRRMLQKIDKVRGK